MEKQGALPKIAVYRKISSSKLLNSAEV